MLAKQLVVLRGEKTQDEVAVALGISRASYAHYEQGRHSPSYEVLTKMAAYFGVSIDYILGKSPFKSASEAKYSITVAVMKKLLIKDFEHSYEYYEYLTSLNLIWDAAINTTYLLYEDKDVEFIEALRKKPELTDLEYYQLGKFVAQTITWTDDFTGPVKLKIQGQTISCDIDYWKIPKIRFFPGYFNEPLFDFVTTQKDVGSSRTLSKAIEFDSEYLRRIPLVGRVAAGDPILAIENPNEYIIIDTRINKVNGNAISEYFALEVVGQSMEPTIFDGEVVLVKKQPIIEIGQIGVFRCNREDATIKRFRQEGNKVYLIPDNKQFPVQEYTTECECVGLVIESVRRKIK